MRGCRCVRMQGALRVMLREHNPCRCACVLLFLLLHSPLHGLYLLAHTPSRFELFTVSLILQWPLLGYLCFPGFIFRAVRPARLPRRLPRRRRRPRVRALPVAQARIPRPTPCPATGRMNRNSLLTPVAVRRLPTWCGCTPAWASTSPAGRSIGRARAQQCGSSELPGSLLARSEEGAHL